MEGGVFSRTDSVVPGSSNTATGSRLLLQATVLVVASFRGLPHQFIFVSKAIISSTIWISSGTTCSTWSSTLVLYCCRLNALELPILASDQQYRYWIETRFRHSLIHMCTILSFVEMELSYYCQTKTRKEKSLIVRTNPVPRFNVD
jgi:hypothetical protein